MKIYISGNNLRVGSKSYTQGQLRLWKDQGKYFLTDAILGEREDLGDYTEITKEDDSTFATDDDCRLYLDQVVNSIGEPLSGFYLDPNPMVTGVNIFASDADRDVYFSANPDELAKYDNNNLRLIRVADEYENREVGTWVNSFTQASGTIDLGTHSVEELQDITSKGSGAIITAAERTHLEGITDLGSGIIISTDERTKLGEITDTGSGSIITQAERDALANAGGILPLATQQNTDFTATWQTRQVVVNTANAINITLPNAAAGDVGKTIEFLISSDPENFPIIIHAPNLGSTINTIGSSGTEVAKARIASSRKQFWSVRVICLDAQSYVVEEPDSVYNELLYKMFVNNTVSSVHNEFNMSAVIPDFLTRNASWWFAIKFAGAPNNNSNGQVLFSTPGFAIAYRGNGTYMMTSGTSDYLMTISPNRIPQNGYWMVFSYDSTTTRYSCWINGSEVFKVINNTTSGVTPPSAVPTRMDFGRDVTVSAYLYGLMEFSTTCMMVGSGYLTDEQGAEFVYNIQNSDGLTLVTPTNEWIPGANDFVTKVGTVNLTKDPAESADVEFSQL